MGLATLEDFKNKAVSERERTAREITLPSGLVVLAWQPSLDWWLLEVGRLPESLAAKTLGLPTENGNGHGKVTLETVLELAKWTAKLIETVVIKPKIRLHPTADDEVSANLVSNDDLNFLIRFAGGEVTSNGRDLATFRDERRVSDGADFSVSALGDPSKPDA